MQKALMNLLKSRICDDGISLIWVERIPDNELLKAKGQERPGHKYIKRTKVTNRRASPAACLTQDGQRK